jgi:hypothetical protein
VVAAPLSGLEHICVAHIVSIAACAHDGSRARDGHRAAEDVKGSAVMSADDSVGDLSVTDSQGLFSTSPPFATLCFRFNNISNECSSEGPPCKFVTACRRLEQRGCPGRCLQGDSCLRYGPTSACADNECVCERSAHRRERVAGRARRDRRLRSSASRARARGCVD